MPRFYFNVYNGNGATRDDEGIDLSDQASAVRMAMDSIRSIVAEEARKGTIDLDGYIQLTDETSTELSRIAFPEAFILRMPGPGNP